MDEVKASALEFHPSLSVSERYDTNVLLAGIGLEEPDRVTSFSLGADFKLDLPLMVMSGRYDIEEDIYVRHTELNSSSYPQGLTLFDDLSPWVGRFSKRFHLKLTESYYQSTSLPAYSAGNVSANDQANHQINNNEGIQLTRSTTTRNRTGIEFEDQISPILQSSWGYANTRTHYQDSRYQGFVTQEGTAALGYQWTPLINVGGVYSLSHFEYAENKYWVYNLNGSMKNQWSPSVTSQESFGISWIGGVTSLLSTDVSLRKAFRFVSLEIGYSRGIGTGGGITSTPTLSQKVSGNIGWRPSERTFVVFSTGYGRNTSPFGGDINLASLNADLNLGIQILSWLSGGVSISRFYQVSHSVAASDTQNSQLAVSLKSIFPPWRF